jgi:hypothetical protein
MALLQATTTDGLALKKTTLFIDPWALLAFVLATTSKHYLLSQHI